MTDKSDKSDAHKFECLVALYLIAKTFKEKRISKVKKKGNVTVGDIDLSFFFTDTSVCHVQVGGNESNSNITPSIYLPKVIQLLKAFTSDTNIENTDKSWMVVFEGNSSDLTFNGLLFDVPQKETKHKNELKNNIQKQKDFNIEWDKEKIWGFLDRFSFVLIPRRETSQKDVDEYFTKDKQSRFCQELFDGEADVSFFYQESPSSLGSNQTIIITFYTFVSNYQATVDDPDRETEHVRKFGHFVRQNIEALGLKGIDVSQDGINVGIEDRWQIHFTHVQGTKNTDRFLVRKLHHGRQLNPDDVFHSLKYGIQREKESKDYVLTEFLEYLVDKFGLSQFKKHVVDPREELRKSLGMIRVEPRGFTNVSTTLSGLRYHGRHILTIISTVENHPDLQFSIGVLMFGLYKAAEVFLGIIEDENKAGPYSGKEYLNWNDWHDMEGNFEIPAGTRWERFDNIHLKIRISVKRGLHILPGNTAIWRFQRDANRWFLHGGTQRALTLPILDDVIEENAKIQELLDLLIRVVEFLFTTRGAMNVDESLFLPFESIMVHLGMEYTEDRARLSLLDGRYKLHPSSRLHAGDPSFEAEPPLHPVQLPNFYLERNRVLFYDEICEHVWSHDQLILRIKNELLQGDHDPPVQHDIKITH